MSREEGLDMRVGEGCSLWPLVDVKEGRVERDGACSGFSRMMHVTFRNVRIRR